MLAHSLPCGIRTRAKAGRTSLVDVVPVMENQIKVRLVGKMPPRVVETHFVVLASRHRDAHPVHDGIERRGCAGHAHRTHLGSRRGEAVPVMPMWTQSL